MSRTSGGRFHRFAAFFLFTLHTTVYTLPSSVLLWMLHSGTFAGRGMSQALPTLPNSVAPPLPPPPPLPNTNENIQSPVVIPAAAPIDPTSPPPPLGYPPPQLFEGQPTQFNNRYLLGTGDTISALVERFPDLSFQSVIDAEGNIVAPLLGKISVLGLTLEEAQEKIRLGLNRFVIDPAVTVTLAGQRPAQVTISGEVVRPGFYTLAPGAQLSAALLIAGGSTNLGDLRSVLVRRARIDGSTIEQRVDLFTPLLNGQSLPNLRLQDGDAVVIPKLEVATEQNYDRALVSRSTVSQQQINIRVLSYAGGGIGSISLPNGSTFVDALSAIGPSPDNSNLRNIALIRFDPERGKAVTQKIDGKAALLGNIAQNVPLRNNDVIVVGRNLVGKITYALSTFTQPFRDILGFLLFFDQLRESATDLFGPTTDSNNNSD
ncbi:polysaccharide export protein [Trichocoleus sp. DQ-A3]|uniref:polysaccharide biosynthesis/export family protein n=1 Tax=Cyanophyceae TaxID=3028117 RepID=UPI001F552003|nr:polysaccharide biosynthesis/export family protein [Coleofasciculus sp. FACHB-125]